VALRLKIPERSPRGFFSPWLNTALDLKEPSLYARVDGRIEMIGSPRRE
jgi:hypothetical protein